MFVLSLAAKWTLLLKASAMGTDTLFLINLIFEGISGSPE